MLSDSESVELLSFLKPDTRPDVKGYVINYILGLSTHSDGCRYLRSKPNVLVAMVTLMSDPSFAIAKNCYHAFINLSADETLHQVLVTQSSDLLPALFRNLLDPEFQLSDQICTILSNLSRSETTCRSVFKVLEEQSMGLAKLVEIFCTEGFNKTGSLHHLAPLLANLTQLPEARHFLLDEDKCVIKRLLPYSLYEASTVRRRGVIGLLHNCCFDYAHHEWLLSDAVDILPFLLLPLAGPEELTDEENEGLPIDLQYLSEDKKRESDPGVRKLLLESLLLLTATKAGRKTLKNMNVYPILREFHGWEAEPRITAVCEKVIQVLIGDEPEKGMENLMEVNIPDDVEEKMKEADRREEEAIKGSGD